MNHSLRRLALSLAVFASLLTGHAIAQDPQVEPPKTAGEFFDAVEYELNTGKFDIAAAYLKGFLAANPTDKDFLEIERRKGLAAFLRLRNVAQWSADKKADAETRNSVEEIIAKASAAVQTEINNPERIKALIGQLRATPEERGFALRELQRSSGPAVPQLVQTLLNDRDPSEQAVILSALPRLQPESVPPLLAALDMTDATTKTQLINALAERSDIRFLPARGETNPIPTLTYLANSPQESDLVRRAASAALFKARGLTSGPQPQAKVELAAAADKLFRHQVPFGNPQSVPIWRWEQDGLKQYPATVSQAEEYLGLKYARSALLLDPSYEPAQTAFISLAAEKAIERGGLDKPLSQTAPGVNEMLSTVHINALNTALEKAMAEGRTPLVLALVRAIAPRGDRASANILTRAIHYPDRRVAFAATDALLRQPYGSHAAQARIVEVLRRALSADSEASVPRSKRILIAHYDIAEGTAIAEAVRLAGYEPIVVRTGREMMRRLKAASDIDGVILDHEVPYPMLEDNLASLRYDVHVGLLPVRVSYRPLSGGSINSVSPTTRPVSFSTPSEFNHTPTIRLEAHLNRLIESYRQTAVVAAPWTVHMVRHEFGSATLAEQPGASPALSLPERKLQSQLAIEWLKRMATGEIPGYDIRPAGQAILAALGQDDLASPAIDAASRLPGSESQSALANYVLSTNHPPELRAQAAEALSRHAQRSGNGLTRMQLQSLLDLLPTLEDPALRSRVAIAIGILQATPLQTGQRLQQFIPAPPAGIPAAKPAAQ